MIRYVKFKSHDRHYKEWDLYDLHTLEKLETSTYSIDPIQEHLMNHDTISIQEDGTFHSIIYSTYRETKYTICGVLLFDKMYGSIGKKYYFRFIPDDHRIPEFLVPYKLSKVGFHKREKNKYAIIYFDRWTSKDTHPIGSLVNIIGDVDKLENIYEYQLYCKSLHSSIREIQNKAQKILKEQKEEEIIQNILEQFCVEDRTDWNVLTIDPTTTRDYDDAFSVKTMNDGKMMISIYISNVVLWMEQMKLWYSFSERTATIYLPDRKRPMLPSILSDALFSLKEGAKRFAFTLDIIISENEIIDTVFSNTLIKVCKNYTYEEDKTTLLSEKSYRQVFDLISQLNRKDHKYCDVIRDSHDVITYLMVLMNVTCAKKLESYKDGIYRVLKTLPIEEEKKREIQKLPSTVKNFVWGWNSHGGKYVMYNTEFIQHDVLRQNVYIHITSPIRRLVDMLNMIKLQELLGLYTMSEEMSCFYNKWTSCEKMEYINTCMRSIRHLQNDCHILHLCFHDETVMKQSHTGYIIEKIQRNDGMYHYIIYIPSLRFISSYVDKDQYTLFQTHAFKLYLFKDEYKMKQKILLDKE